MEAEDTKKNMILELVEFATRHADGINVLWTIVAGLAVAALFFFRPIYRALFDKSSEDKSASQQPTVVVQSFDSQYFRDLIRNELERTVGRNALEAESNGPNASNTHDVNLMDAVEQLSKLRQSLRPPDLIPDIFPSDLDVIEFNPTGRFRIRIPMPIGSRVFVGLFCLPHYLIFPGMLGGFLFDMTLVGGFVGLGLWIWRNKLGTYISIDFKEETFRITGPAFTDATGEFPDVTLNTSYNDNLWKTVLSIEGQEVIERISEKEPPRSDLEQFAKALQWRLGKQIELAEGVYICP